MKFHVPITCLKSGQIFEFKGCERQRYGVCIKLFDSYVIVDIMTGQAKAQKSYSSNTYCHLCSSCPDVEIGQEIDIWQWRCNSGFFKAEARRQPYYDRNRDSVFIDVDSDTCEAYWDEQELRWVDGEI